jgi:RNA-splicing ligase RtcB
MLDQPFAEGADVRIMPDVHAGAGCVIGFTAKLTDKVVPNLIGVDIGCGVLSTKIPTKLPPLKDIDDFFKQNVPTGFNKRHDSLFEKYCARIAPAVKDLCDTTGQDYDNVRHSIGTLGGGNHFAEIDSFKKANWFTVHTGSRNFGLKIATHFQKIAEATHPECPKGLAYLEGKDCTDYLSAMAIAQQYASANRKAICDIMMEGLGSPFIKSVESVHNYIDLEHGYIRKGAISAYSGESVVIPLNMRDGVIFGTGKGNEQWNYSAPHGAGRTLSRSKAKSQLSLDDFAKSMEGIYSTCITKNTLDESPMVYKNADTIIMAVSDTIDISFVALPIWNAKGE